MSRKYNSDLDTDNIQEDNVKCIVCDKTIKLANDEYIIFDKGPKHIECCTEDELYRAYGQRAVTTKDQFEDYRLNDLWRSDSLDYGCNLEDTNQGLKVVNY